MNDTCDPAPGHDIIAIGGSWGAVDALKTLLGRLPSDLSASVVAVVHTSSGGDSLGEVLAPHSAIPIAPATDGEPLIPGHAVIAPPDRHLLIIGGCIRLGAGPRENMSRPAIDALFRSVAVDCSSRAVAVLLTGRLNDGAAGMVAIRQCGGITVVQNPGDALAREMPLAAIRTGEVDYRASLAELPDVIAKLVTQARGPPPPVPDELRLEVEIALGGPMDTPTLRRIADPVALSCPACGGVLSEIRGTGPVRFRCQVGHGFTGEVLYKEQESAVDEAVRVALRIVEERATLTERMAQDARQAGRGNLAETLERRAEEYRGNSETLRRAALRSMAE